MKKLLLGLFLALGLVGLAGCGTTYVSHPLHHSGHVVVHHTPIVVHHYHAPVVVHHYHAPVIVHHTTTHVVHTTTSRPTVSLRKR